MSDLTTPDKKPGSENSSSVVTKVAEIGMSEIDLRFLTEKMRTYSGEPLSLKLAINQFARSHGLLPDQVRSFGQQYAKEQVLKNEQGCLYHYHSIPSGLLEQAASDSFLLSTNTQKDMGRQISTSGTRPDVVQMTRDQYDNQGNLTQAGVGDAMLNGDRVSLVFKPSIMDTPGYDGTGRYPTLTSINLRGSDLEAALVADESKIQETQSTLERHNIHAKVMTLNQWEQDHYQK